MIRLARYYGRQTVFVRDADGVVAAVTRDHLSDAILAVAGETRSVFGRDSALRFDIDVPV